LERVLQTYRDSPLEFEDKPHFKSLDEFALYYAAEKNSTKLQSRIMSTVREDRMDKLDERVSPEQREHLSSRANKDSGAKPLQTDVTGGQSMRSKQNHTYGF